MTPLLYRSAVRIYGLSIRIASLFSSKAAKWKNGRKELFEDLERQLKNFQGEKEGWIWIHSSSLGEFEQVRPLLEELRTEHPRLGICLTFFSPSGYEARKDKKDADIVTYMPLDLPKDAQRFVEILRPELAIFVKYELWHEHLAALKKRDVPTFLIAAVFREDHRYFRWYGGFFRKMLKSFDRIHVQESRSKERLEKVGIEGAIVSGDPRYDRVSRIAKETSPLPFMESFKGEAPLLIGGSSWPPEEKLLQAYLQKAPQELKLLLAPHDVGEKHIRKIQERFSEQGVIRYSQDPSEEELKKNRVLIVDRIGLLGQIYQYGDGALIGGGFTGALHNVLEAAAHGNPVFYGPDVTEFPEAVDLIVHEAGFAVTNASDLEERIEAWRANPSEWKAVMQKAERFVENRKGATEEILEDIEERLDEAD